MLKAMLAASAAASLLWSSATLAQSYPAPVIRLAGGAIQPNTLYALETRCSPGASPLPSAGQPNPVADFFQNLFPHQTVALWQVVEVSNDSLTGAINPNTSSTLGSLVSMVLPFSVDTSPQHNIVLDNTHGCDQNFLVTPNPKGLFITSSWSVTSTTQTGAIAEAFNAAFSLVNTLAPVVAGAALGTNPTKNLTAVQNALPEFQKLFAALFPSGFTQPQQSFPLRVGTTEVFTQYSRVTVTLRPVRSIVEDLPRNEVYLNDLGKEIAKLTYTSPDTCVSAQAQLAVDGFTSQTDQAYGVGRLATLKAPTQIPQCLTNAGLCFAALDKHLDFLWEGIANLKPTKDICTNSVPVAACISQPPASNVISIAINLSSRFTEYGINVAPGENYQQRLSQYFSVSFSTDDESSRQQIGSKTYANAVDLVAHLKELGFVSFGCYTPVNDPPTISTFCGVVSFVGGRGTVVPPSDAIVIYPVVGGGHVSKLVISDDEQLIRASISAQCKAVQLKAAP